MKTAMIINTWPGGNPTVARNWPYLKNAGMDIFGAVTTDGITTFPEPIPQKALGISGYINGINLVTRTTGAFRWFLEDPIFKDYSHVWLHEHDAIFIRTPIPIFDGPLYAHHAGGQCAHMESPWFFHLPWIMDRPTAIRYVDKADELTKAGRTERGYADVFFGLVMHELGLRPDGVGNVFSINSGEMDARWPECEAAVKNGAWYIHGIKTASQLHRIEKLLGKA